MIKNIISKMLFDKNNKYVYYGKLLLSSNILKTNETDYMAVLIDNQCINLYYNEKNIKKLSYKHITKIIEHEMGHILNNHFIREIKKYPHQFNNLCMDLSINSYIDFPPDLKVVKPGEGDFEDIEKGLSYEEYTNLLKDKIKIIKVKINHTLHRNFYSGKTIDENKINDILKSEYTGNEGIKELDYLFNKKENSIHKIKRLIQNKISYKSINTFKRPNKKYPLWGVIPGKKDIEINKILFAIDSSGSISDKDFMKFNNIINNIQCDKTIIIFDNKIINKITPKRKIQLNRSTNGLTDYNVVYDFFSKNKFKHIFILTDLMAPIPKEFNKKNSTWICVNSNTIENQKVVNIND